MMRTAEIRIGEPIALVRDKALADFSSPISRKW
jgi:hypothetical protein